MILRRGVSRSDSGKQNMAEYLPAGCSVEKYVRSVRKNLINVFIFCFFLIVVIF